MSWKPTTPSGHLDGQEITNTGKTTGFVFLEQFRPTPRTLLNTIQLNSTALHRRRDLNVYEHTNQYSNYAHCETYTNIDKRNTPKTKRGIN